MAFVLEGKVVPLASANEQQTFKGRVYVADPVDGVGRIEAVKRSGQAVPAGFANAPVVSVGDAFIYPGLIDLHSHLGYNTLPLWSHPGESKPFLHHDIWPGRSSYKPKVSWPAWVLAKAAPEALLNYVQVRALAGGTTAIQGWPSANRRPANDLVRNIDDQKFDNEDRIRTSTLTLDLDELRDRAEALRDKKGFIYHCSEGRTGTRVTREFDDVATAGCLRQRLIAIHCCAVGEEEFAQWEDRAALANDPTPGTVVWSPFSNLWLYDQTTDIPAARQHNVAICLGTDWGPSGTKNLLGELKVARLCSDEFGWNLSNFELVKMVTATPGDALGRCWKVSVGRLKPTALADITVVAKRTTNAWKNLVEAHEKDVLFVAVNGKPVYGTYNLMRTSGARKTTSVRVGRARRRTVLINAADKGKTNPRSWTWNKTLDQLHAVREDPRGAVDNASMAYAGRAEIPEVIGPRDSPLVIDLDMPGGLGVLAGPPPTGHVTDIPRMPSLRHDRNWRASVKKGGLQEGVNRSLLNNLKSFYT